jgi:hypothetical protein
MLLFSFLHNISLSLSLSGHTCVYLAYGLGSAPRLAYRGSEKSPISLHFWVPRRDKQAGSHAKTLEQRYGDIKDPYWWDKSFIHLMSLNTQNKINLDDDGGLFFKNTNRCGQYTHTHSSPPPSQFSSPKYPVLCVFCNHPPFVHCLCDATLPWAPRSSHLPSSCWDPWVNYGWHCAFSSNAWTALVT